MKDIGLVGVPYSGKSTLFTAITRHGAVGGRANQAVVAVPDPRIQVLADLERSKRAVPAQVRFVDVPGVGGQAIAALRETDALCVVVRGFGPDADPARELADVRAELVLGDLVVVENALENAKRRQKGRAASVPAPDVRALERAHQALSRERLLRDERLDDDEAKALRGLAPLTLKPWIVVANVEEGAGLPRGLPPDAIAISAQIEAETAGMPEEEAVSLLTEFGVAQRGLERVIAAGYRALDLITFLTTGEDETRAWEVRRGAKAPEAAGVIHTDLQRGFIRAEVVAYDDVVSAGGWDAARTRGLLRIEGKDYVVREGDVLHVRFAV